MMLNYTCTIDVELKFSYSPYECNGKERGLWH